MTGSYRIGAVVFLAVIAYANGYADGASHRGTWLAPVSSLAAVVWLMAFMREKGK